MFYSIIYCTCSSCIFFYIIQKYQPDHLPKFFGGTLNIHSFISIWPKNVDYHLRYFFIISVGHHLERTYNLLFKKSKKKDFWTMLLHHVLTMNLMIMCFGHRQFLYGIPILLIHDITDIFLNIMRVSREIKPWKFMVLPLYFLCLISWFITRNGIFNFEIVIPLFKSSFLSVLRNRQYNHIFASLGVFILMILNTYWFLAIGYAGYKKVFKNIDESSHEGEVDIKKI